MNCKEIKIWLSNSSDEDLFSPSQEVIEHLSDCDECTQAVNSLRRSMQFISEQKKAVLSEEKTLSIINTLQNTPKTRKLILKDANIYLSRIAAILIIAFGLLIGIIAGGLIFSNVKAESDPWSSEFTILSENTEFSLFE